MPYVPSGSNRNKPTNSRLGMKVFVKFKEEKLPWSETRSRSASYSVNETSER
jgi:hypothetical protein